MKIRVLIINLASLVAMASLLCGLIVAVLAFTGDLSFERYLLFFNLASLIWFLSAPLWLVPHLFGEEFKAAGQQAWLRPRQK